MPSMPQPSKPPSSGRSSASRKCKLSAITNPILNGVSVGLTFGADGLQLCSKTFNCCGGLGWQDTAGGVKLCELHSRFNRVRALERSYAAVWGKALPFSDYLQWLSSWDFEIIKTVSRMLKGYAPQCRLIENSPLCIKGKPSACWAMALVAIWRFGKQAQVVPFHQVQPASLHTLLPKAAAGELGFVLVEKVEGLYREDRALWLEYLVHFAYGSNVFLILEIPPPAAPPRSAPAGRAAKEFQRRLGAQKAKPFHEHLDADCQSKLGQMQREPNPKLMTPVAPIP